jgi:Family of unknown function (DUF6290)
VTQPDSRPDGARTTMVSVRLSRGEEENLKRDAEARGLTLSQYIRSVLLRRDEPEQAFDYRLYAASTTAVTGGLAIEAAGGSFVPKTTTGPYVSAVTSD